MLKLVTPPMSPVVLVWIPTTELPPHQPAQTNTLARLALPKTPNGPDVQDLMTAQVQRPFSLLNVPTTISWLQLIMSIVVSPTLPPILV